MSITMPRRRPASAPLVLEPAIDYGPTQRRDIDRETRPDIDHPQRDTLGGRVRDPFAAMWRRELITSEQFHAGDRLRGDIERSGGTLARGGFDAIAGGFGSRVPGDATLAAIERVRAVWAALGIVHSPVVVAIVLRGATIGDYERAVGLATDHGHGAARLRAALDVLIGVYERWAENET